MAVECLNHMPPPLDMTQSSYRRERSLQDSPEQPGLGGRFPRAYLSHDARQVSAGGFDAGMLVAGQPLHLGTAEAHVQPATDDSNRRRYRALNRTQV